VGELVEAGVDVVEVGLPRSLVDDGG